MRTPRFRIRTMMVGVIVIAVFYSLGQPFNLDGIPFAWSDWVIICGLLVAAILGIDRLVERTTRGWIAAVVIMGLLFAFGIWCSYGARAAGRPPAPRAVGPAAIE